MKTYVVNNEKYVSARDLIVSLGFNSGLYHYYAGKDPAIRENTIEMYHPPDGGKAINIINKNGANRLLGYFLTSRKVVDTPRYGQIVDIIEDRTNIFDDHDTPAPPITITPDSPGTSMIPNTPAVDGYMPVTAEDGIQIMQDMFEGKTVRYKIDDHGMQWVLGQDLKNAIGLDKDVFSHITNRIREKYPSTVQAIPAIAWALGGCKMHGGRPRITLNKYGIAHFFMELDIARLRDPDVKDKCERFRVWIARLVGDVMTGDVKITSETTPTPAIISLRPELQPINTYAIITHTQTEFSFALQVGALCPNIPGKQLMMACLKNIMGKTGFNTETYMQLVEQYYTDTQPLFDNSKSYTEIQDTIKSFTSKLINRIEGVDNQIRVIPTLEKRLARMEKESHNSANIKHVILAFEQNGYPANEAKKIVGDAENIAANEIPM
jgi:hypothetical protein